MGPGSRRGALGEAVARGHCHSGVSGRLGIRSLLPILSASGPRRPRSGEAKAAAAAASPPGGEGGEKAGRSNLAEMKAKAPEPPERNRARLGVALWRGPALTPERLALAASRGGRAAAAGDGRVVLSTGRRAGKGAERARCRGRRGARVGSEAAQSPGPRALRSFGRVTRQSCLQAPGAPHPPAASRCALRRGLCSAGLLSSCLPPPACAGRLGAGRRARKARRRQGPPCSGLRCLPRRQRCRLERLKVSRRPRRWCPSSLSRWHTPQGRERAGGWRPRPRAGLDRVQIPPRRSSSLCPLFFYSPRFFSQGEKKKSRTISVCARALR